MDRRRSGRQHGSYAAGDVIAGRYRLVGLLGEGGMGSVWLARNLALDVEVAVKLIRDVATPDAARRLLHEARAAAQLRHTSIVTVHDFGETEQGDPFLAMERIEGESLAQALNRKGRLPALNAVQTLLPIAAALAVAHAKGIVHCDLKPANIVLATDDGGILPKVVDFGIVKVLQGDLHNRSLQSTVLGTPSYMSPEQLRGRGAIDQRTDVWAFSVVLYECLVGCLPFAGENHHQVMRAILEKDPLPITEFGDFDPALARIVARGLAKTYEARWASIRSLGRALAEWARAQGAEADVTGSSLQLCWLNESARRPLSDAAWTSASQPPAAAPAGTVLTRSRKRLRVPALAPAERVGASRQGATRPRRVEIAALLLAGIIGFAAHALMDRMSGPPAEPPPVSTDGSSTREDTAVSGAATTP